MLIDWNSKTNQSINRIKHIKDFRIKDHYFRIDYTINQGVCKPIEIFNKTTTIASIQHLVRNNLLLLYNLFCLFRRSQNWINY
jgi:hypothetical protein